MAVETAAELAAFFDTDGFALAATYKAGGVGTGTAVSVIRDTPTRFEAFDNARLRSDSAVFLARAADMPAAAAGDTLTIGAAVYRVQAIERDIEGAVLTLDTRPQGA